MTLEEFETLTALSVHLLPNRGGGAHGAVAASFDLFLHECRRETPPAFGLPPNIQHIRAGLQLLNSDALRLCNRPFSSLSLYQQEAVWLLLQSENETHWPQLSARRWHEEILTIAWAIFEEAPEIFTGQQAQRSA